MPKIKPSNGMSSLVTAMPVINKRLIAHNSRGPDERDGDYTGDAPV